MKALETRRQEDVEKYATKGLSVADTDGAKAALVCVTDAYYENHTVGLLNLPCICVCDVSFFAEQAL